MLSRLTFQGLHSPFPWFLAVFVFLAIALLVVPSQFPSPSLTEVRRQALIERRLSTPMILAGGLPLSLLLWPALQLTASDGLPIAVSTLESLCPFSLFSSLLGLIPKQSVMVSVPA